MENFWYELRPGDFAEDCAGTWDRHAAVQWLESNPLGMVNVYERENHIYTVILGKGFSGGVT